MRHSMILMACLFLLGVLAAPASADTMECILLQAGDDEREDAASPCLQEAAFQAGIASTELNLKVGGNSFGCDSEFATSMEFDLSAVPQGLPLYSATLIVRKTGYSDDAAGFAYIGAFAYGATGSVVQVPRDDLSLDTALDVLYPPAQNADLSFDVTAAVQDWIDDGETRVGLLISGIYSEAGYEDWISIGGMGHSQSPRLVVEHEGTVTTEARSWSGVKGLFR